MSELRYNKLSKEWVLFAPNRAKRPINYSHGSLKTNNIQSCPFEVGNESKTPDEVARIDDEQGGWRCRVVPNLYHALDINDKLKSYRNGCFEVKSGFGAHEVIIETPDHEHHMFEFSVDEFFNYFSIIKIRLSDLKNDVRIKYFSVFKNFGINGGATLEHPHSQLIATPFIPKSVQNDLNDFKVYKEQTQRDFFDDIIYEEVSNSTGILYENERVIAFCPYASRYPFEISIMLKAQKSSILELSDTDIYSFSEVMQYCFSQLKKALGECDFNMLIKNGAIAQEDNPNRFHIQILPRLYKMGGFELDSDIMINTFFPHTAAKILKEA
jgi:UDPglucose--hexose-1-phosphate uridylyltransferase